MNSQTRTFLEKIHAIQKAIPIQSVNLKEYLNADNKAQINIHLYDKDCLYNPYTIGQQKDLAQDIYDVMDQKVYNIPLKYGIVFNFTGQIPEPKEQEAIAMMVQKHYLLQLADKQDDLKINRIKIIACTVVGLILLIAYFLTETLMDDPLFTEILSIVGGYAIWEAADFWFMEKRTLQFQYLNIAQCVNAQVCFSPLSEKK